jgi:hypothetical protein
MNRLILIGNGFDLAHGLKTSYADFIDWYWNEWGKQLLRGSGRVFDDGICSFKLKGNIGLADWYNVWHFHYVKELKYGPWKEDEVVEIAKQDRDLCDFTIKSLMLNEICRRKDLSLVNWDNIEDVFYSLLKQSDNPKQLNDDLDLIKGKLVDYLNDLQNKHINPTIFNAKIQKQIFEIFNREDIAISSMDKWDKLEPDYIMILNFNYTNTADMYLPDAYNYSVNHIHGTLSNPDSVIFGYGDERDDEYDVLMKKNDNEYLQHIKSFRYLEASNYRNMLSFIESAPYQICIMGHSCGLSDRTLLSTLFEHKNCVSIKPYYHKKEDGSDNYRELVQNIARNFKDPTLMRDRVVQKDRCEPLG